MEWESDFYDDGRKGKDFDGGEGRWNGSFSWNGNWSNREKEFGPFCFSDYGDGKWSGECTTETLKHFSP